MRLLVASLCAITCIVGCSEPEPLAGIDLPPASLPEVFEPKLWTVTFRHVFDAGFWSPGHHVYSLHLDCPEAGENRWTPTRSA